ncbi:alpha/beta hydrolase [Catenuloplanes japonicus]|uniref:alpha/beta hydrolase n=1 Tax=Catenuloplanes japonicus TaxID=33876 RepID=UPI0005276F4B|nr:alpha/beta hydrolase [Catenuloplanes japonicus]
MTDTGWQEIRETVATLYGQIGDAMPPRKTVRRTPVRSDLVWFSADGPQPGSAVVHVHGGGMVAGSVDLFAPFVADHVARSGVPFLSVEHPRAPEARGTAPAEAVFAALTWLHAHAAELGVDPARIGLFGHSSGAGLAAGAAILARDRGVPVARQILIYPMLDDRTTAPDPHLAPVATWTYANNAVGWEALLGGDEADPVAAPARLADASGLPPAYIEVGELDIFRDKDVAYAAKLWRAGVSAELHVHPGLTHGFDHALPDAEVTRRVLADRVRVLRSL